MSLKTGLDVAGNVLHTQDTLSRLNQFLGLNIADAPGWKY